MGTGIGTASAVLRVATCEGAHKISASRRHGSASMSAVPSELVGAGDALCIRIVRPGKRLLSLTLGVLIVRRDDTPAIRGVASTG